MREWLRCIRDQSGLSQAYVANIIGIRQSAYSMIEIGERNPHPSTAKKIAVVLNFEKHGVEWTKFFEEPMPELSEDNVILTC